MENRAEEKNKKKHEYRNRFRENLMTGFGILIMGVLLLTLVIIVEFYVPGIYVK